MPEPRSVAAALAVTVILPLAVAGSGCERLLGIQDPILVEADGDTATRDAGSTLDDGGAGDDASPPRSLAFTAPSEVDCLVPSALDIALARSEPGAAQDRAIVALEADTLWVCRQPFDSSSAEPISLPIQDAETMWVGDITGNGTDDVAVLGGGGDVVLRFFEPDGTFASSAATSDYAGGVGQKFIQGAALSASAIDLVLVRSTITLLRGDNDYVEQFEAELGDAIDDATFAGLEQPRAADFVYLTTIQGVSQVVVMPADAEAPHYETNQRYNLVQGRGELAALAGSDGLITSVVVPTADGLAVLDRAAAGDGFDEAYYVDDDLGPPLAAGDLSGDGIDDLVGLRFATGGVWLGGDHEVDIGEVPLAGDASRLVIGDVDGDGLADIIAALSDGIGVYHQTP